ncbi:hypothetical protein, partial [Roseibium sp.]
MTKSGFEGVLHDIPAMDHLRYASLIDLAQEVYPLVGQTVIVHGSDLGCLMGVASDVSDLYYIIEKRNGETYWASAVGWISGLKDRLPEREYRACHLRDEAAVEMQIIVDEGLDRIWIAGNDPLSGEGRSLKDALVHCHTHIVKEARSTVGWIPSYLKRHIADIYPKNDPRVMMVRDALCSPDFTRIFISHEDVNLSEALDILDTLRDKENEKLRAY